MTSKSVKRTIWNVALMILSVAALSIVMWRVAKENHSETAEEKAADGQSYESRLFDGSYVHSISIQMNAEDYTEMLETAQEKNKYRADVTVDGELFSGIAVSTKGSASLRAVVSNEESSRYSLKLTFDKYDEDLTYYGLEAIHLNNNVSDASYMQDYISYSMFREMGYPAPLASYTTVSVNGEPYGFFVAVENIGEGFLKRTLDEDGELYKPEMTNGMEEGANGCDLTYRGDSFQNYTDIFENAVTDCSENDREAVIRALKNLSEGNVPEGVDTDMVCMYFALHNFTLNSDSYLNVSNAHNYFLYENDGLLSMLPWDYNNAYSLTDSIKMDFLMAHAPAEYKAAYEQRLLSEEIPEASYFINKGIDTPLMGESTERPMWSFIPENEAYLKQYHSNMDRLITEYYESGFFDQEFNRVCLMIHSYIEADTSRLYSMDEVETGAETLYRICTLRAKSIRKQLDGGLSCDSTTQNEADWIDASVLDQ